MIMKDILNLILGTRVPTPIVWAVIVLTLVVSCWASASGVPAAANQYQRTLIRTAHAHWGLDAPIATFAAQIHQESLWMPNAVSHAGAQGMAQFMPTTSSWIAEIYPDALGSNQPLNPGWALRALVIYDRWILKRVTAADNCNAVAMMLSGYNGGLGWVHRDQRLASASGADSATWFNSVEQYTSRADWARRENRRYVRLILLRWEPLYEAAGWGTGSC